MKVLVIGSGGREHTFVWKIAQSPQVSKVFCAPGNAGISQLATCVDISADDIEALAEFAASEKIELTVVGPEAPLAAGIVDLFTARGLKAFGPSKAAAELEASKAFSKEVMRRYGIPTAGGASFTDYKAAVDYVNNADHLLVVKADGLAAGKGVVVCDTKDQALEALSDIMQDKAFGDAGTRVVIEERLAGEEASFIAITDGKTVLPFPASQDHKAVFDGDKGPNTGGMGAYSPAPIVDRFMHDKIMKEVMEPMVQGMASEGKPFSGFLYAGLMIDRDRLKVLEFNVRMGDPETQPLLMRLESDLVPLLMASVDGTLDQQTIRIDPRPAVCVVMAAGGYPGSYDKGAEIAGLDAAAELDATMVFHAGTALKNNSVVTSGGRVLGVTALGETVADAIKAAYKAVDHISWEKAYNRMDIGQKAINRQETAPQVGIIMGSDSDLPVMNETVAVLKKFGIPYEITVASAHRTPEKAGTFAKTARDRGVKVIIAGAGHAAHLAGAMAAHSTLPIIGVPIGSSALSGWDALLSTVQMPPGVPVATVAIGKPGARNAGVLAVQILSTENPELAKALDDFKDEMAKGVEKKNKELGFV